jgi:uncharacterized membrane protein
MRELLLLGAILAMALVTYMTRAGGLVLMRAGQAGVRAEKFIRHASSSVLVALVVTAASQAGQAGFACVGAAVLVMFVSRNIFAAMIAGATAAALVRCFI